MMADGRPYLSTKSWHIHPDVTLLGVRTRYQRVSTLTVPSCVEMTEANHVRVYITTIIGFLIVLVVTGFNAPGNAIRDAIDMEATLGEGDSGGA